MLVPLFTYINLKLFTYLNKTNSVLRSIRINSLIHALLSSLGGILYLNKNISLETQYYIIKYSRAYIIYDIYMFSVKKELFNEKYETYLHHGLFFMATLFYNTYPNLYSNTILTEISTIPLNLQYLYKHNKDLKIKFSLLFYITFLIFRILHCNYVFYKLEYTDIKLLGTCSLFSILNMYWFYSMTRKLIKFIKEK